MRSNMISQNYTASSFETHHRVHMFQNMLRKCVDERFGEFVSPERKDHRQRSLFQDRLLV